MGKLTILMLVQKQKNYIIGIGTFFEVGTWVYSQNCVFFFRVELRIV